MPFLELDVLNAPERTTLGIDLGTTYSLVALWRDGRPVVLRPKGRQDGRIPSAIHFPAKGPALVGWPARERAASDPGATIFSVKRFMGRGLEDARADLATVPFPASETENGVLHRVGSGVPVQANSFRLTRLGSFTVCKMSRENANRHATLGQNLNGESKTS